MSYLVPLCKQLIKECRFSVIPCTNKRPPHGYLWKHLQDRFPTDEEVVSWLGLENWGRQQYAIITGKISNLVVVDGDSPEAVEWMKNNLPDTPFRVKTSKGEHWYFQYPAGHSIGNRARITIEGQKLALDVRGEGGYVVGPGSLHESGVYYEAVTEDWNPKDQPLPMFPVELLETKSAPEKKPESRSNYNETKSSKDYSISNMGVKRLERFLDKEGQAIEGSGGDDHTFRMCCFAWDLIEDDAISESDALQVLESWDRGNIPPWGAELQKKWGSARKYKRGSGGAGANYEPKPAERLDRPEPEEEASDEAAEPIHLSASPPFPVELLPKNMRDMVGEVSRSIQAPSDMAATIALAALSLILLKRAHVQVDEGFRVPLSLYCLVAAEPGSRKSPVFEKILAPIEEIEEANYAKFKKYRRMNEGKLKTLQMKIDKNRKDELKNPTSTVFQDAIESLEAEVDSVMRNLEWRQLKLDDTTTEAATQALADNNECIGCFSTEGGIFRVLAGKYKDSGADLDNFLKAFSGDPITVNRKRNREKTVIRRPLMAIGVMLQPKTLLRITGHDEMRDSGLLARFLYAVPPDIIGKRLSRRTTIDKTVAKDWEQLIYRLHNKPENDFPIRLSKDAKELFEKWDASIEIRMDHGGPFFEFRDWASKIAGTTLRVAGIFHACVSTLDQPLSWTTLNNAIELTERYWIPQAASVLDTQTSTLEDDIRTIWADFLDQLSKKSGANGADFITYSDLKRRRRRFRSDENRFDAALQKMATHRWVYFEKEHKSLKILKNINHFDDKLTFLRGKENGADGADSSSWEIEMAENMNYREYLHQTAYTIKRGISSSSSSSYIGHMEKKSLYLEKRPDGADSSLSLNEANGCHSEEPVKDRAAATGSTKNETEDDEMEITEVGDGEYEFD